MHGTCSVKQLRRLPQRVRYEPFSWTIRQLCLSLNVCGIIEISRHTTFHCLMIVWYTYRSGTWFTAMCSWSQTDTSFCGALLDKYRNEPSIRAVFFRQYLYCSVRAACFRFLRNSSSLTCIQSMRENNIECLFSLIFLRLFMVISLLKYVNM